MPSGEAGINAASALPIIDIAPWVSGHDHKGRISTAAAIHAACLEFGFFYLDISSFASTEEPEELARLAREFFALAQDEKDNISLNNQDRARGKPNYRCRPLFMTPSIRIPEAKGEHYPWIGR